MDVLPLPEFSNFSSVTSLHFLDLEREMSSLHCEDGTICSVSEHYENSNNTDHYSEDSPNMSSQNENPLVWGDDIIFMGPSGESQDGQYEEDENQQQYGSSRCSSGPSIDEDDKETLHRQLMLSNEDGSVGTSDKNELDVTGNMDTMDDLHAEMLEPGIGLVDITFFARDEEVQDLNDICETLQLGGIIETKPSSIQEVQEAIIADVEPSTKEEEEESSPPAAVVKARSSARRTRNTSRRSTTTDDAISFCSQAASSRIGRRRTSSEHSLVSYSGSYDDPDSPYSSKRKRRRYEEEPSDDPAFEKSRKNAIIAKRNREKKKQLMEQMEIRCDKLTAQNESLDMANGKLRHRVQTLEEEVFYLKSVLANQSSLSNVLSTLKNVDEIRFSSSFDSTKYKSSSKRTNARSANQQQLKVSGGICLHVDGNQVSMEMCAKCAQMACGAPRDPLEPCGKSSTNNKRTAS